MPRIEDLEVEQVLKLLEDWQLQEFKEFVSDKQVDGRKLMDVTEGLVKLWRPKVNAKKLILFVEDLKINPSKYFGGTQRELIESQVECQYQTVKKPKLESTNATITVEELLKKLVPAKSFLYRNQSKHAERVPSYLPMDAGTNKTRKFFRLSSYEYPSFHIFSKFSKAENKNNSAIQEDRGYYSVKTNNRYLFHKIYKKPDCKTKYKSLPAPDELPDKLPEDHFYEDLCYNDVTKNDENKVNDLRHPANVKPCLVKLQELFNSFKVPFFRKPVDTVECKDADVKTADTENHTENETNYYENGELACNMYDSVHVRTIVGENKNQTVPVEEYLEPVCVDREYCDISVKQKEESLLGYIMSLFEHRFGMKRETSDPNQSEGSDNEENANENNKTRDNDDNKMAPERVPHKMADRPLPVPVENEPYYMNVDRAEAENLLRGTPDGTFILRPSSQSNHAYTLSVSCANAVHNVGVRRRPDGRLALGFARRGERSFLSVPTLLRHHRRRRLLLVAAGGVLGATTLTDSPHYYQTPTNIPIVSMAEGYEGQIL